MALFGGNKKLCPACGNPATRFLPTKVEGQPLCIECADKTLALTDNLRKNNLATMETLRAYLADYNKNQALRDIFQESYRLQFGFWGGTLSLDVPHRLLRLDASNHAFVLEPSNIRCFHIFEDRSPLFEGTKDELICYQSAIPDRIMNLGSDIERIHKEQREYKQLKRLEDILEQQAKLRGESYSRSCIPYPDINQFKPFEKFYLLIEVDHPYCKDQAEFIMDGPSFYGSTIKDYLHEYTLKVVKMRELATQFMNTLNPDAPERRVSNRTKPGIRTLPIVTAAPANPVTEIKK